MQNARCFLLPGLFLNPVKHVMQRPMFYLCSSVSPACLIPYEQVDAAGATLFPLQTAAQGQEMSSNPPPSFAFNSIYVWVWYLAQAALVMHDIFNVRWERMWFEFGCGRSLLLWIELKVFAYLVASGGRTRVNRSRLYSTIVGFGWMHASGHVVQTSHLLNLQSKRPRARLKPRVPTCWFEVFYTS